MLKLTITMLLMLLEMRLKFTSSKSLVVNEATMSDYKAPRNNRIACNCLETSKVIEILKQLAGVILIFPARDPKQRKNKMQ